MASFFVFFVHTRGLTGVFGESGGKMAPVPVAALCRDIGQRQPGFRKQSFAVFHTLFVEVLHRRQSKFLSEQADDVHIRVAETIRQSGKRDRLRYMIVEIVPHRERHVLRGRRQIEHSGQAYTGKQRTDRFSQRPTNRFHFPAARTGGHKQRFPLAKIAACVKGRHKYRRHIVEGTERIHKPTAQEEPIHLVRLVEIRAADHLGARSYAAEIACLYRDQGVLRQNRALAGDDVREHTDTDRRHSIRRIRQHMPMLRKCQKAPVLPRLPIREHRFFLHTIQPP